MQEDLPDVDVRALLGISAPLSQAGEHARRAFERGRLASSLEGRSEPGDFESDPFWMGAWARLQFKPLLANPFPKESTESARWASGWKREDSAIWEIWLGREAVLSSLFDRTIRWGPRTAFSSGLAALLEGESRTSNPCTLGEFDYDCWDGGWLRGFWLKGYAAAFLGEPRSYSERAVQSKKFASDDEPLPDGSEELDWWQAGWEACDQRLAFERRLEEIREAGEVGGDLGATVAANPHPLDTEESEAWLEGWRIGNRSQAADDDYDDPTGSGSALLQYLRSSGPSGRDAFVRGDPLEANPFAAGSREWFRWKEEWRITEDVASGVYADAGEVPDDYDADDREGNLKRAQAAREDQEALEAEMDWPTFDDNGFDEEEYERRREAEERRIEELVAEARILNKKP